VATGRVVADGAPAQVTEEIRFPSSRANKLLGTALSTQEMADLLERVGVASQSSSADELICSIPSYRNDLHLHQDLTEEVARVYGYERILATEPTGILRAIQLPRSWSVAEAARDNLVAAGLVECQSLPFVSPLWLDALRLDADDPRRRALRLANPIREDEPLLRTTLLPSILRLVQQNRSRQANRVDLFEVARLFRPQTGAEGGEGLPAEPLSLVAALTDCEEGGLWEPAARAPLFFKAKGIAKKLLNQLGYMAWFPGNRIPRYLHPGAAVTIEVGEIAVGALGELHPDVAASFELDVRCAVIELDLTALMALPRQEARLQEVSTQPSARRDLAIEIDLEHPADAVREAIRQTGGNDLISVELFDRYQGKGIAKGRVGLGFRLVFQRSDRTLKDAEVTKSIDRIVRMLAHRFNAELR
jgi:phenylalanyl-tRNA synthetase beta chain